MTDHKAELTVEQMIDNAHDNYMRGNIDATTRDYLIEKAKRTAAPAASEGEDGAVIHATCGACRRPSGCPVGKCAILLDNTPAAPAAQAADDPSASTKHDEGRDLSGVDFIAALCSALVDHPLGPQSISHAAMTDAMHAALLAMKNSGEF